MVIKVKNGEASLSQRPPPFATRGESDTLVGTTPPPDRVRGQGRATREAWCMLCGPCVCLHADPVASARGPCATLCGPCATLCGPCATLCGPCLSLCRPCRICVRTLCVSMQTLSHLRADLVSLAADSYGLSRGAHPRSLSLSRFWFDVQKVRRNLHTTRSDRRASVDGALDKSVRACVPVRVGHEAGGVRVVGNGRFRRWRISQSGAQPRVLIPSRGGFWRGTGGDG